MCDKEVVKFSATQVSLDSWRLSPFSNVHLFNLIKHWSLKIPLFLLLIIQTLKYPFFLYLLNIPTSFYIPQFSFSCFFPWISLYCWPPTLPWIQLWSPAEPHWCTGMNTSYQLETSPPLSWFQPAFFYMAYNLAFFKSNFSCYSIAQQKKNTLKVFLKEIRNRSVEIVEGRTILLELRIDSSLVCNMSLQEMWENK